MGVDMGVEWTMAMELARVRRLHPGRSVVVESLVYEAPYFRGQGGRVVRLERPGHVGPAGVASDAAQAAVAADVTIRATDLDTLRRQARRMVEQMVGGKGNCGK